MLAKETDIVESYLSGELSVNELWNWSIAEAWKPRKSGMPGKVSMLILGFHMGHLTTRGLDAELRTIVVDVEPPESSSNP